jgi:hypothetical protein
VQAKSEIVRIVEKRDESTEELMSSRMPQTAVKECMQSGNNSVGDLKKRERIGYL